MPWRWDSLFSHPQFTNFRPPALWSQMSRATPLAHAHRPPRSIRVSALGLGWHGQMLGLRGVPATVDWVPQESGGSA